MEWTEEQNENQRGIDAAFSIIYEGPPPLTARQQKARRDQAGEDPYETAARQLTLNAYPPIYPKETEDSRLQRASAFDSCWNSIEQRIQSTLESTDAQVFSSILNLARTKHPSARTIPTWISHHGLHRIPTGVVLAGGVNSADHVRTFPNLASYLREAGCYVSLLTPSTLSSSLSEVINSTLRQFSGLHDTAADQFAALTAWYQDELEHSLQHTTTTAAGAGAATTMIRRHATVTTTTTTTTETSSRGTCNAQGTLLKAASKDNTSRGTRRTTMALQFNDIHIENSNHDDNFHTNTVQKHDDLVAIHKRENHHHTARTTRSQSFHLHQQKTNPLNNACRPLVIIIESVEGACSPVLADLITVASEGYHALPITLVLGITTTTAALQAAVPSHLLDRSLEVFHYNLATAIARLDCLVKEIFLGREWPGLILDGAVVGSLWESFLVHYFSPSIVVQGWKLCALEHFRTQPLCQILPTLMMKGGTDSGRQGHVQEERNAIADALQDQMDQDQQTELIRICSGGGRGGGDAAWAVDVLCNAIAAWRVWSIALHWIVVVAQSLNMSNDYKEQCSEGRCHWSSISSGTTSHRAGFTYWQLYRDCSSPAFLSPGGGLTDRIGKLTKAIAQLHDDGDEVAALIDAMLGVFASHHVAAWMVNVESTGGGDTASMLLSDAVLSLEQFKAASFPCAQDDHQSLPPGSKGMAIQQQQELQQHSLPRQRRRSNRDTDSFAINNTPGVAVKADQSHSVITHGQSNDVDDAFYAANISMNTITQKKDRYHSKATRKAALLSKAQAQGRRSIGLSSNENDLAVGKDLLSRDKSERTGIQLARWLSTWLLGVLKTLPSRVPGSDLFTCRGLSSLDCLSGAPRESVHAALTRPETFFAGIRSASGSGSKSARADVPSANGSARGASYPMPKSCEMSVDSARAEDVCIAYSLFDQDPACSNVADWFVAFKEVLLAKSGSEEAKKKKKRAQDDEDTVAGQEEVLARFSQAVAELQYIGMVRPAKKRRGDHVQRAVHMPSSLLEDF